APMIADTVGVTARVGVAGGATTRRELSAALSELRVTTSAPTGEWATMAERGDVLAAHFAGSDVGPMLRADGKGCVERARTRKAVWTVVGAAAAVLLVAAGVELWGVHHQLNLVRAERERIRPQIASTMLGRTTVDATSRSLALLNSIDRSTPQWSAV